MTPSYASLRRWCRRLHYWFGIGLALPILLIAVTGCVLTFGRELDSILCPDLYRVAGPEQTVSAQKILETASELSPAPIIGLQVPDGVLPVWIVSQGTGKGENMGVQEESFFDPSTGKLLGRRLTAEAPIRFVHRLHNAFLLGADGRQVVGLVGLVMAGMILTGLVVWWRPAQGVRRSFLPRWGRGTRLLLDLHTATSLWPFVVIVVLTVTGITMEFPQATRAILGQTGESHGMGRPTRLPSAPTAISADLAMAIAQDTAPEEQLVSLALPSGNHRHWRVVLRPRHGPWRERHQVMVDAESGEIHAEAAATGGMAAAYLALQHALHSGAVFGRLGRVVVLVTGLCLAFLTISGLLVWAKRQMRQSRDATECDCTQDLSAENT